MPFGIKANIRAPHKFYRFGALCWITLQNPGGGSERIEVAGMSRGGRVVRAWVDARDLDNYRAGWLPDGAPHAWYESKEQAQNYATGMNKAFGSQTVRPHAAGFSQRQSRDQVTPTTAAPDPQP